MRVYHFVCQRFGLESLEQRRLKIARIAELNDPFEWMARAENERERTALREMKEEQNKKSGLLCFSKSWESPVLWSHYADRHRGVCLAFEVPDALIKEVDYRKSPLRFERHRFLADSRFAQEFSDQLVSTKYQDWQYEREIRLFVKLDPKAEIDGRYFCDFSNDLRLAEVIVGVESLMNRQAILTALGEISVDVKIRKARLAFKSFRIIEQRNSPVWG